MIVLNPAAHLLDLVGGYGTTRAVHLVQADAQIPDRPMPLPSTALAARLTAGQVALHQGTAQDLPQRGQKFRETLAAVPQGHGGELRKVFYFCHRAVVPIPLNYKWESHICEFPAISLSYFAINLACEVPAAKNLLLVAAVRPRCVPKPLTETQPHLEPLLLDAALSFTVTADLLQCESTNLISGLQPTFGKDFRLIVRGHHCNTGIS
jgi:hypothetical protein